MKIAKNVFPEDGVPPTEDGKNKTVFFRHKTEYNENDLFIQYMKIIFSMFKKKD